MLDATTAEMIKLCVMAQRTKKLARNHKSAFPEKPIMPASLIGRRGQALLD